MVERMFKEGGFLSQEWKSKEVMDNKSGKLTVKNKVIGAGTSGIVSNNKTTLH